MGPRPGSSIGAFLMSLPVSAILLMAVFGIPRFDPGTAGESGWQRAKSALAPFFRDNASPTAPADPFAAPNSGLNDDAPRFAGDSPPASGESGRETDWPFSVPREGEAASGRDSDSRVADRGGDLMPRNREFGTTSSGPATITWTQARRKLADLGIDQFHLEAGLDPDQFLFVCLFSPGADTRVTQRFEAEATEPLVAVEQVLRQVDDWLASRYAEENRPRQPGERQ